MKRPNSSEQKDAARFRFLVAHPRDVTVHTDGTYNIYGPGGFMTFATTLRAAVDKAMRAWRKWERDNVG